MMMLAIASFDFFLALSRTYICRIQPARVKRIQS
jgi:hypothetical protein